MGLWFSNLYRLIKGPKPAKILMVGLDAAGKTTICQRLRLGETVTTIPTIGFNVDEIEFGNIKFTVWDIGGQDLIRKFWLHYYDNTDAIIFVVDSSDTDRIGVVKGELWKLLEEEKLKGCSVLVYANKQDLSGALTAAQLTTELGLNTSHNDHMWKIQPTIGVSGDGLIEGLDWLSEALAKSKS